MLRGYEASGADYFTKPFSVAVLCKKIAAVFETIEQLAVVLDMLFVFFWGAA